MCWLKRLIGCVFTQWREDSDALYGREGFARPRSRYNDTPQMSLSGLLIGHGHLPLHEHIGTWTQRQNQTMRRQLHTGGLFIHRHIYTDIILRLKSQRILVNMPDIASYTHLVE